MKVRIFCYGLCELVSRSTVLNDLQYQYEGTEPSIDGVMYDVYSNDAGDCFAVKEDEN